MRDLSHLEQERYDLIIIGGGINGAAAARDAALRGLKTLLVEKNDFASGTTSWSTRLVHGGLRYLEYFEFNLVRESLKEREILLRIAPHLVHPLLLTIPIYAGGQRSYWEVQAGMVLYDLFSFDKTLPGHRLLRSKPVQQLFRGLNSQDLKGAAQYYDGQAVYAERLCLETLLSAQTAGATVLNYVKVTQLHRTGDCLSSLSCQDMLSQQPLTVHLNETGVVINTAGPWVDEVLAEGEPQPISQQRKIGGTKGSHIIVESFPGAPQTAFYVEAASDGRPFFIVPWLNLYLIGTTDLHYDGDLDRIKISDAEVDYLIKETNHAFPQAQLTRKDVCFTYSGVRPLPYEEGKKPGQITRSHILFDHSKEGVRNLISLIGGKLTTFRQVGEEFVDAVYRKRKQPVPVSMTAAQPLPGAIALNDPLIEAALKEFAERIPKPRLLHLFSLYGRMALEVLERIRQHPELAEPIVPYLPDMKVEVVQAVEQEWAYTLVDICRRRTTLSMQAHYGFDALPAIAQILRDYCGWSEETCDRQIADYHRYIETNCCPDYAIAAEKVPTSSSSG